MRLAPCLTDITTQFAGAKLLLFSELTKFFAIKYLLSTNFVLFLPCFFRLGCRYRIKNVIRNSYIIPVIAFILSR